MTGITNQIQTPLGSGVNSILGNAFNTASGISLIPANPSVSFGGNWPGPLFTIWEAATLAGGNYTPVVLAHFDDVAANNNGGVLSLMTGALNLGSIQAIHNGFSLSANGISSFSAPSLIQFGSVFGLTMSTATSVSLPNLTYVGGALQGTWTAVTSISMPSLVAINSDLTLSANAATSVSYPNLVYIGGELSGAILGATSVNFNSLAYVLGSGFSINISNSLTTLNFPAIVTINSTVIITGTSLANFSFGSTLESIVGNVTMTGCALTQASVDGILVSLAALNGTGGTTAYSGLTVNLSGGTSSAPSSTGLTAKATLVARSCTVTTN